MIHQLILLLLSFGKIGLISLGGGNSMLKLIETEAVNSRHWILPEEFVQMMGTSFLFPGLTAVKLAALIGYKTAGILGLLFATISLNLPGLVFALLGYKVLNSYNNPIIHKINGAVQYGALALLAAACFSVGKSVLSLYYSWPVIALTLLFFIALVALPLSPFWGFLGFIGICFFFIS